MISGVSTRKLAATALSAALLSGCAGSRPAHEPARRKVDPHAIAVPAGYKVHKVVDGLTYPTSVLFDDDGRVFVIESGYAYGESWAVPRLLRVEPDDRLTEIARGDRNGPWTGGAYHKGYFYVAEGGVLEGGRILRIDKDTGRATALVSGLPSTGDHPTTGPVIGPDGLLYFGQGTMTNAGVVGADNERLGWLSRHPEGHDIPCRDVELSGAAFDTPKGRTAAFMPAGRSAAAGQRVPGRVPCNGAVMRLPLEGEPKPELVAWGFRDPFGLGFSPKGRLFVSDAGYDHRGSRPVWGAGDAFWSVSTGTWHGWPDYAAGRPVSAPAVLAKAPGRVPRPVVELGVHGRARGFDFSRSDAFGHVGEAFLAQFGDLAPFTGKVASPVGYKVVRVDADNGLIEDFAVNKGKVNGPASRLSSGGFERPIAARFSPDGRALYVVDFGELHVGEDAIEPRKGTGVLWKITRN